MKSFRILSVLALSLSVTDAQAVEDTFELRRGETHIKMTFQNPHKEEKADEQIAETQSEKQKPLEVALQDQMTLDPKTEALSCIEHLARYAQETGKTFYYRTIGNAQEQSLQAVHSYDSSAILGLRKGTSSALFKALVMKQHLAEAWVDASLAMPLLTTEKDKKPMGQLISIYKNPPRPGFPIGLECRDDKGVLVPLNPLLKTETGYAQFAETEFFFHCTYDGDVPDKTVPFEIGTTDAVFKVFKVKFNNMEGGRPACDFQTPITYTQLAYIKVYLPSTAYMYIKNDNSVRLLDTAVTTQDETI